MTKNILLSLSVLALLQACGGGDGGDDAGSVAGLAGEAKAGADAGTISAKFVPNKKLRTMLVSASQQTIGGSEGPVEQADSGAVTRLGTSSLTGAQQTVDIAGNAHFALGRWLQGTVTRPSGPQTLSGRHHESYHYLAFNSLTKLPSSGKFQCKVEGATAPTALSDNAEVGSASGTASLSFDAKGAAIQGAVQVQAAGASATVNLPSQLKDAGSTNITGALLARGAGAALMLTDQGGGAPGLAVWYKAQMPGRAFYTGIARFACSSA